MSDPAVDEAYKRFPDDVQPIEEHPAGKVIVDRGDLRYAFLEGAAFAAKTLATSKAVNDEVVEKAWAAIVGKDVAPLCFQASIIRADLRTALEAILTSSR